MSHFSFPGPKLFNLMSDEHGTVVSSYSSNKTLPESCIPPSPKWLHRKTVFFPFLPHTCKTSVCWWFGCVGLKFLLGDGSELRALAQMTVSLSHKRLGQSAFNTLVLEIQQDMLPDDSSFFFFPLCDPLVLCYLKTKFCYGIFSEFVQVIKNWTVWQMGMGSLWLTMRS